jgi:glycosyltransferase involved in cell wall biosynthesis
VNDVHIISLKGGDFVIPAIEGFSLLKKFRGIYRFHSYRKRIRKTIDALKNVAIIEVAEYGAEGLYLQRLKIPVVYRLHTPALLDRSNFSIVKFSFRNWYCYLQGITELSLLKKYRYITSCSSSLAKWVEKFAGIDEKYVKVIYNPVNIILQDPAKLKSNVPVKTVLFAGTIVEPKGIGDLFETGEILANEGVSFIIRAAGKESRYSEILKQQGRFRKWFEIVGKLTYDQLIQKYKEAAIVCLPSWWEAFGLVCIEAMMCGAIVIGSLSGGMSEIITDGEDGFLLEPRNPQKWAKKIKEVFTLSPEERLRISQNAQKKIREKFSVEVIIPQMVDYYHSVIENYRNISK